MIIPVLLRCWVGSVEAAGIIIVVQLFASEESLRIFLIYYHYYYFKEHLSLWGLPYGRWCYCILDAP